MGKCSGAREATGDIMAARCAELVRLHAPLNTRTEICNRLLLAFALQRWFRERA